MLDNKFVKFTVIKVINKKINVKKGIRHEEQSV